MFRQFIAVFSIAWMSVSASADSIVVSGKATKPKSVSYIGYDSFDANGNPVCTPCLQQTAEEAARLKAYAERRARSREYMARMQGNAAPTDSLSAEKVSELLAAGVAVPAQLKTPLAAAPLRAGVN